MKHVRLATAALVLVAVACSAQPLQRHPLDKSQSRQFTLDNGLKVLLLSDPAFNKSAAALDVAAGSLSDPRDRQGLAHFLEHMLFLGTEKYPDVEAYSQYLKQSGGYSNAFTADDHTNYHFEVQHDALEGALDRFAQFFIAPLFTPAYIDREVKAVQSEHKKNLLDDGWREHHLLRMQLRKDHPANHFGTGDVNTLKGIARPEFIRFYDTYYCANQMSLVILSVKGLDELEAYTRRYFAEIPARSREDVRFPADPLEDMPAFRTVRYEPVKDLRELSVVFDLPGTRKHWASKPAGLVGYCFGHEGKGSLLSYLKNKGWATALGAGPYEATADYGQFSISIQLTEDGLANQDKIVESIFSYVEVLKAKGVPKYIFDEAAQLASLQYSWSDKGEGADRAVGLATTLNNFPKQDPLTVGYRYEEYRPDLIRQVIDHLIPENAIAIIAARGVETNQKDPYYGTEFSVASDSGATFKRLKSPTPIPSLHLPEANPFISQEQNVLSEQPVLIVNETGARLYYLQDTEFRRPKISFSAAFRAPAAFVGARNEVIGTLYAAALQEQLNELAYPALEAGVHYSISGGDGGISVGVSGYDDSARKLLETITPQLTNVTLDPTRFEAIKERILRSWQNAPNDAAWRVTREVGRELRRKVNYLPEELLAAAADVALDDVRAFPATIFAATHVEALIHGNVDQQTATQAFNKLRRTVNARPLAADKCFDNGVLLQPAGELLSYVHQVPSNNSCFWRMLVVGNDSPKSRAAAAILGNFISEPFYSEMRTEQQLGYVVFGVSTADYGQQYLAFIIQSGDYPADVLRDRAEALIATLPDRFDAIADAEFEKIRAGVRAEHLETPKSIAEKAGRFYGRAFELDGDFDRTEETVAALDALTKAEVGAILRAALETKTRRGYDLLTFAAQHKPAKPVANALTDLETFRKGRRFARYPKEDTQ